MLAYIAYFVGVFRQQGQQTQQAQHDQRMIDLKKSHEEYLRASKSNAHLDELHKAMCKYPDLIDYTDPFDTAKTFMLKVEIRKAQERIDEMNAQIAVERARMRENLPRDVFCEDVGRNI